MTRSRTTPSLFGTETLWNKKESQRKNSRNGSQKDFKKSKEASQKKKYVYSFGKKKADGTNHQKNLLGGKGAGLHEMTRLGLPVPPGFTISTEVCHFFYKNNQSYPQSLKKQVTQALLQIEKQMDRKFGDAKNPLLLSVRSGARSSMPGMMDTILNLGLNEKTLQGLIGNSQNEIFAYDSYRRLISMYGEIVLGIHPSQFEAALENQKEKSPAKTDSQLRLEDLKEIVSQYKLIIKVEGKEFPEDPFEQLWGAIGAVFKSWMNPRAVIYRKLHQIPEEWGTAVTLQAMVFGNKGDDCATGVAFTRHPSTGERIFFGEFLINAQGEDIVAGIRTPSPINENSNHLAETNLVPLNQAMPEIYNQLVTIYKRLENHYGDMQDIEFTIEKNRLFILQTRNGKRTPAAALKIAVDMVKEKRISKQEAILRVQPEKLSQLLHPCLNPSSQHIVIAQGLPASPGAAAGIAVFDSKAAEKWTIGEGKPTILVRLETSPEDIQGMSISKGILTARGGMTSHAAVVARGMGKCCVSGCSQIKVSEERKEFSTGKHTIREGDFITLNGATGEVILGEASTIAPILNDDFKTFMRWADAYRKLEVRANADTKADAKIANNFGAKGIGLCRTEHMFFHTERIDAVREMILSSHIEGRKRALEKILPMQKSDFKEIFLEMKGLPVTIRLLDPPLHEFIPRQDEEIELLSQKMHVTFEDLKKKAESLHEFNPMLGHRGCRLGISYPEIYQTQVQAIMEAACELSRDFGLKISPEIMVPLIGDWRELKFIKDYCIQEIEKILFLYKSQGVKIPRYQIGTMIEIPRAALTASEIAEHAAFFSFGTNDLTQTTYGLSRDDSGVFLKDYLNAKIYEKDPFSVLDPAGVGRLMEIAIKEGRSKNPNLKIGLCGEHGGDPLSIEYCHRLNLDYVSCSPYRIPIAKLAAAQAALKYPKP